MASTAWKAGSPMSDADRLNVLLAPRFALNANALTFA